MKPNFYIIFVFILFKINLYSQQKTGIINYEISTNTEELIEGLKNEKYPQEHKDYMLSSFKNSENINYQLHFNNDVSTFFYERSLELDDKYNFNLTLSLFGENTYFTNIKTKKILKNSKYLENKLIELPILEWKITTKTKKIGNYLCYMASAIEKTERDGKITKTKVTAWFTTDIPISFGPKNYNGLPGLVLEVNSGLMKIKATKIELNSNKKLKIIMPKGEIITNDEAELIFKKMLENRRKMN